MMSTSRGIPGVFCDGSAITHVVRIGLDLSGGSTPAPSTTGARDGERSKLSKYRLARLPRARKCCGAA